MGGGTRRLLLIISLATNLGLLFFFKYFNFFSASVYEAISAFTIPFDPVVLEIILPVGISFYTFQTLSYTIDVYRRKIEPERHLGYFALYVSFFPQLVAGPIERPQNLLPQFRETHKFNYDNATYGLKLIAWGFFKKLVVADILATYVNLVYNDVTKYTGFALIIPTIFFALQIYCDFSGYSDIAIGSAKLMGFNLMKNFNSPYFSTSIKDFWNRWHISLSSWFRDYVYIPLGGSRVKVYRHIINLLITFIISGLWHGANWTFVAWGFVHGIFLSIQVLYNYIFSKKTTLILKKQSKLKNAFKMFITFALVCFAWIFFRANSISDAMYIISNALNFSGGLTTNLWLAKNALALDKFTIVWLLLPIGILFFFDLFNKKRDVILKITSLNVYIKWLIYILFILFVIFAAPKNIPADFIYFQF